MPFNWSMFSITILFDTLSAHFMCIFLSHARWWCNMLSRKGYIKNTTLFCYHIITTQAFTKNNGKQTRLLYHTVPLKTLHIYLHILEKYVCKSQQNLWYIIKQTMSAPKAEWWRIIIFLLTVCVILTLTGWSLRLLQG